MAMARRTIDSLRHSNHEPHKLMKKLKRAHSMNFYYNFGSKRTTQPFLDRKILLPKGNHTNGEKFKMTGSRGFVF